VTWYIVYLIKVDRNVNINLQQAQFSLSFMLILY